MRAFWIVGAGLALVLAACDRIGQSDPITTCLEAEETEARIEACGNAADDQSLPAEQRSIGHSARGDAYVEGGDVTAALRDYGAALELDSNNYGAQLGRALILFESGQLDAAEPLARQALQQDTAGQAHDLLGQIQLRRGQFSEAITTFNGALDRMPQSASALAGRARAKQRLNDLEGAANDYDAAVRADGNFAPARAGRCWLDLNEERELIRARQDADTAVRADPNLVEGQLCRGTLQLREAEWANARASFEAALAVESGNPIALFGRGVARRRSGDRDGTEDMNLARDFDRHIGEQFDDLGVETF